jgi:hypothetical protein
MQRKIRQPWFSAEMIFSGPSSLVREKKRLKNEDDAQK